MYYTTTVSPVGTLLLSATDTGLAGVYFEHHKHFKGNEGWDLNAGHPILLQAKQQLQQYFAAQRQVFDIPLDLSAGTAFQQEVWAALREIPFAATRSYAWLAQQIQRPQAVRAVGAANGRNPLSIIIPCHRVIASSGALTGYAGGLENKQILLELESRTSSKQGLPSSQKQLFSMV